MSKKENSKNNILSFKQPAEFFVKKAEKQIDAGNFLEALKLYRRVLGADPNNSEYLLNIAQVYSEMGLFNESNDVLHKIIRQGDTPTECLFALGCNYMGLKKYHLAEDAFEQYLQIDPDGEYAEDIDEFFGFYEDDDYEDSALHDVNHSLLVEEAYRGKDYLDVGEYKNAIKCLERVVSQDKKMYSAANNLALSYFFSGHKDKAIETSKQVLRGQPSNLHACCNLAMFYSESGDHENAMTHLEKLDKFKDIPPHDMHKVALTYSELGFHDKAYQWFSKLVSFQPYDIRILHFYGLAAFNYGLYAESLSSFIKILKIDPGNSLALYYRKKAETAKRNKSAKPLEYVYQVQFDEIKRRIKYLNDCLKKPDGSLSEMWKTDTKFSSIILWGLHFGDEYIKKIVLEIMSVFADDKVEDEFRSYLLKSAEPDAIKNDVFLYLKRMGAKEPYVAHIKGAIAEVRVGSVTEDIDNLPKPYSSALGSFIHHARENQSDEVITVGIELLVTVAKRDDDSGSWLKSPRAFAAAIEYCACEQTGENNEIPSRKELIKKYATTKPTFERYLNKILSHTKRGD